MKWIKRLWSRLIRRPCWVCERCGYRKAFEGEVICWSCGEGEMLYARGGERMNNTKQISQFRCTVCGQIGTVGRCCGLDTREPLNNLARADIRKAATHTRRSD